MRFKKIGSRLYLLQVFGVVVSVVAMISFSAEPQSENKASKPEGNSLCYVCHGDLRTEDIATGHLKVDITCQECHGSCTNHMQDEMLMTKPDLLFGRLEVEKMCSNSSCHKPGGDRKVFGLQDHSDPAKVDAFHKKWLGRTRPNGRVITGKPVCTDCHGTHNIVRQKIARPGEETAEWVAIFNGRDLTGWQPSGDASWLVKSDRIIATNGPDGKGGTLWTEQLYEDYRMSVTFRVTWPIHAGIWLRSADSSDSGLRVEIFDSKEPLAFTGSIYLQGKGLVLRNLDGSLVSRDSWNTISVEARGNRFRIWLNGEEIGSVRADSPAKGKVGLYMDKVQSDKPAELCVREVLIQQLAGPTEASAKPAAAK